MIRLLGPSAPAKITQYRKEIYESGNVTGVEDMAIGWTDAIVHAPDDLRLLPSFWCELNGVRRRRGGPFLLGEIAARVRAETLPDPEIASGILNCLRAWQARQLPMPILKLIRRGDGFQLIDANHRATALLLSGESIDVPGVVVELAPGSLTYPC
jgi:hypothetical protein